MAWKPSHLAPPESSGWCALRAQGELFPRTPTLRKRTPPGFQVWVCSFCFVFASLVFPFTRHLLLPAHVPGAVLGIAATVCSQGTA